MKYSPVVILLELTFFYLSSVQAIPAPAITARAVLPAVEKREPQASTISTDSCLDSSQGFESSLISAIVSLQAPPKNQDLQTFCATYLRTTNTEYLWTSTTTSSVVGIKYTTYFTRTTATATATGTTTVLCDKPPPSPLSSQYCGATPNRVWGFATYPNYDNISAADCKQACLSLPACKAFMVSLDYERNVPGLPGKYAPQRCGISSLTLQQAIDSGTLGLPYNPDPKPDPDTVQGFWDRGCQDLLPAACAAENFNGMEAIDSATLESLTPGTASHDVELHMLDPSAKNPEYIIHVQSAGEYESLDDLTKNSGFAFQLYYFCWCEGVVAKPPATTTVTGVATHYTTTSIKTSARTTTVVTVEYPAVTTVVRWV